MSRTLALRLNAETDERLASLADTLQLKKSQLLRKAFNEWARTRESIVGQNMMLCDSLLLAVLFERLDDDEIQQIAEIMADHIVSKIRIRRIEKHLAHESIPEFLTDFTTLVSAQHFGWFTTIHFNYDPNEKITIYGFHSLNTQYSKYAVHLLARILRKTYRYEGPPGSRDVTDNSFILELTPQ